MKKIGIYLKLAALAAVLLLSAACEGMNGPDPVNTDDEESAGPGLTIYFNNQSRTIYPENPTTEIGVYYVVIETADGSQFVAKTGLAASKFYGPADGSGIGPIDATTRTFLRLSDDIVTTVFGTLPLGKDYKVTVKAYTGNMETGIENRKLLAEGSDQIAYTATTTSVTINIYAKAAVSSSGNGKIQYSIDLTGVTAAKATGGVELAFYEYGASGVGDRKYTKTTTEGGGLSFNSLNSGEIPNVPAGTYWMTLTAKDGYQEAGPAPEIVYVQANLTTKVTYAITAGDFKPIITLGGTIDLSTVTALDDYTGEDKLSIELYKRSNNNVWTYYNASDLVNTEDTYSISHPVPQGTSGEVAFVLRQNSSSGVLKHYYPLSNIKTSLTGNETGGAASLVSGGGTITCRVVKVSMGAQLFGNAVGTPFNSSLTIINNNPDCLWNNSPSYPSGTKWVDNLPAGVSTGTVTVNQGAISIPISGTPTGASISPLKVILPPNTVPGLPVPVTLEDPAVRFDIMYTFAKGMAREGTSALSSNTTTAAGEEYFTLANTSPGRETAGSRAMPGDTITVTKTGDDAFFLYYAYYKSGSTLNWAGVVAGSTPMASLTSFTFPMPALNIVVDCYFKPATGAFAQFVPLSDMLWTLTSNTPTVSRNSGSITVTAASSVSGFKVQGWYVDGRNADPVIAKTAGVPAKSQTFTLANLRTGMDYNIPLGDNHTITAIVTTEAGVDGRGNPVLNSKSIKFNVTE